MHEGAIYPELPPPQHLFPYRRRDPGTHGSAHLTAAADRHIGAHPQIIEKQGDGAYAPLWQGVFGKHLALELIHQSGAAVDKLTPFQHGPERSIPPHDRGQ